MNISRQHATPSQPERWHLKWLMAASTSGFCREENTTMSAHSARTLASAMPQKQLAQRNRVNSHGKRRRCRCRLHDALTYRLYIIHIYISETSCVGRAGAQVLQPGDDQQPVGAERAAGQPRAGLHGARGPHGDAAPGRHRAPAAAAALPGAAWCLCLDRGSIVSSVQALVDRVATRPLDAVEPLQLQLLCQVVSHFAQAGGVHMTHERSKLWCPLSRRCLYAAAVLLLARTDGNSFSEV